MITGRIFEVPRLLQDALYYHKPLGVDLQGVYNSLLNAVSMMEGFYTRDQLRGEWNLRMYCVFQEAWTADYYEGYVDGCDEEDEAELENTWNQFVDFVRTFRTPEMSARLWRSIDRLMIPYNIISPYCLDSPVPTERLFCIADGEE